ncbi:hypothetical protein HD553DRAFT_335567 [Filobasidium floriforme]|uniref:uncharacterized protein n=1 Tax=Filobasidium floriforme TaxID=5210 RepID=UPI001E8D8664|nr:uncharacterized protein HD553DRAFT_335567 [Filobasidium floriforme]KAH8084173.1 hypothetical protein HD553DRAFT_335567 [Filobasidium floriforme]
MESVIEIQRQSQEEIERYEQALADILTKPVRGARANLRNQHKALDVLNRIADRQADLSKLYDDDDGLRAAELSLLSAPSSSKGDPQNDLAEFYTRLDKIKSYHARHPNLEPETKNFARGVQELVDGDGLTRIRGEDGEEEIIDPLDSMFTGEEGMGRYLDLNIAHTQYVNLKGAKRLSYMQYLTMLTKGRVAEEVDQKEKEGLAYYDYVQNLKTYLLDFMRRTHPLRMGEVQYALKPVEEEFEKDWKEGNVDGWQKKAGATDGQVNGENGDGIWCAACQKQYAKQTVYDAHLTSKKHIKAAERLEAGGQAGEAPTSAPPPTANSSNTASSSRSHNSALLTRLTETLLFFPPIPSLVSDTQQNIERRSALTARERELELEELVDEVPPDLGPDETAEEAEERIYNPLKLPLGWDGKPIPYWLYKLHGLGVEYKCEICSDFLYMGRKAFDRHFQESRHAFGMRALGLPNTKHFHEITKIQDALALAERLKQEGRAEQHATERSEEFEDSEGNVYDKKTYDDLKRQGLI